MNKYIENNIKIKLDDVVKIDGVDRIFDPSAYFNYHRNDNRSTIENSFNVNEIDSDSGGEYLEIYRPAEMDLCVYRFNISLKNSFYQHIDKNKIYKDNYVLIGKDISYANIINNWDELQNIMNINEQDYLNYKSYDIPKFINEWFNFTELYSFRYKIIDTKDEYVMIKNDDKKISLVFPYWFLYEEDKPSYKPKKIKRFIDF